jgi:hypothetical protein
MHTEPVISIPEGKRPIGKPQSLWKDNIKMNYKKGA